MKSIYTANLLCQGTESNIPSLRCYLGYEVYCRLAPSWRDSSFRMTAYEYLFQWPTCAITKFGNNVLLTSWTPRSYRRAQSPPVTCSAANCIPLRQPLAPTQSPIQRVAVPPSPQYGGKLSFFAYTVFVQKVRDWVRTIFPGITQHFYKSRH
jgi:hypothetical protein